MCFVAGPVQAICGLILLHTAFSAHRSPLILSIIGALFTGCGILLALIPRLAVFRRIFGPQEINDELGHFKAHQ
ncbi:hypothetical protein GQ42DRAFT_162410 [Ramicandelaber brevisporus]|nr:hypothetical protein GQ42DRAFT_162410 [Ramicandelaber brevisporus]